MQHHSHQTKSSGIKTLTHSHTGSKALITPSIRIPCPQGQVHAVLGVDGLIVDPQSVEVLAKNYRHLIPDGDV